jgi:Fe-S-cluster-containing hydrogenase component 2
MKKPISRRDFVAGLVVGGALTAALPSVVSRIRKEDPPAATGGSVFHTDRASRITTPSYIVVEYQRCTGCGICESECTLFHDRSLDRQRSRIRVHRFEPAIAVPAVCTGCSDAPCIAACPADANALTRDTMTGAVLLDEKKCIGCRACVEACDTKRSGVIRMDAEGKKAVGICDLCGGDPVCVKKCPESCLSIVPVHQDGRSFAQKPDAIRQQLKRGFYRSGGDA